MEAYSLDLRRRVIADSQEGMSAKDLAKKYRVSPSWVRGLKRRHHQTGEIGPRQQRVSHRSKLDEHLPQLQQLVQEHPDATLAELRQRLGVPVSVATLWRTLRRLQLTFKKKWCMPPNKIVPTCRHAGRSGKPR